MKGVKKTKDIKNKIHRKGAKSAKENITQGIQNAGNHAERGNE